MQFILILRMRRKSASLVSSRYREHARVFALSTRQNAQVPSKIITLAVAGVPGDHFYER